MELKIKKLNEDSILPTRGSEYAAGYDLYAYIKVRDDEGEYNSIEIKPHETVMIHTGIAAAIPHGFFGGIYARSGLATKQGLRLANSVGACDEDFRGEIIVALHNDSEYTRTVEHGERVAQLIVQPYCTADIKIVDDLGDTERGAGGFGSTGLK